MEKGWQHEYDLGKRAFDERDYDAALVHLEKVAAEKTGFADVHNMLGLVYYNASRHEDAIAAFRRAIEINPSYTEASLNLAVVYNELGRFDKSAEVYTLAKQARQGSHSYLDPFVKGKLANMHSNLARIYKDMGFYAEAVEEYRKALRLRPEFADIRTSLGVSCRDMRDYNAAVRELQEAVRQNPSYPDSRIQLGLTYYAMGQRENARTEWQGVLRDHPDHKMARMYMNLLLAPAEKPE
ncbi:MAG: tetratricopeptide repeat protein [Deltaproteobacteria bacterium]|nr:tetratricopeptide repeat protein [Deltaproteobacteria bacterium]MBZ0218853.1 tetratricopeptide repeat protein [Deltaproteobacteria bacterium]